MSIQKKEIVRNAFQNKLLDLEKDYFNKIYRIVESQDFKNDLLAMEREIKINYGIYSESFARTNKINIMVERLICHYLYMNFKDTVKGVYPSPISSDFGVRLNDCILCVDAKTININTNAVDIDSTQFEENQNSFQNHNFSGIEIKSRLKAIDYYEGEALPVLTYIIKVIYSDDGYNFNLNRGNSKPTVVIACIPNGELSILFENNIVKNCKTYNYYDANDGCEPIFFDNDLTQQDKEKFLAEVCEKRGFIPFPHDGNKIIVMDRDRRIWWETSISHKKCLRAVKSGSNIRVENEFLQKRYDSSNEPWNGYQEIFY